MLPTRKPTLSIIISSDNDYEKLRKCILSFEEIIKKIKNIEFIIINNFSENIREGMRIQIFIEKLKFLNIVFYQTNYRLTSSQIKNLGLDFSKGTWLFFLDYKDVITPKFASFLQKFKFDIYKDFYRVATMCKNNKKHKMGFIKNKYFSSLSSSMILNQEYLERNNIRWENDINYDENLIFLDKIYSTTNVNYVYLSKQYSVTHDSNENIYLNNFDEVLKTYEYLLRNKDKNYRQFIIILFFNYLKKIKKDKELRSTKMKEIKKNIKSAKIRHWHYLNLGPKLFFRTFMFRWKTKI